MARRIAAVLLSLLPVAEVAFGDVGFAATPLGDEFQVNAYGTGFQVATSIGGRSDGGFVVVWFGQGGDEGDQDRYSVQGRRFDSHGSPVGAEFQVNSYATGDQGFPAVGVAPDDGFVVVWQSEGSAGTDDSSSSIQGQRYDPAGAPLGGEFQVNAYTTGEQSQPALGVGPEGGFVVVWRSDGGSGSDSSSYSVQARRYDANGQPLNGQFQVNSYTTGRQSYPSVGVGPDGGSVVVWESGGSAGSDTAQASVQGRRLDASGNPLDGDFQVNTYTKGRQGEPSVAVGGDSGFVVVWLSSLSASSDNYAVLGQRFEADGSPLGSEFQVNTLTTGNRAVPTVRIVNEGEFVVAWQSYANAWSDTASYSVRARRYDGDGGELGEEFQVNEYTTGGQFEPRIGVLADGDFIIVWASEGGAGDDQDHYSAQARRFASDADRDGLDHVLDNCVLAANPLQTDVDADGYGNWCDADYDNDGAVGGDDFNAFRFSFLRCDGQAGYAAELDADSDGCIGAVDFNALRGQFLGAPGPSGLLCAGTTPCPAP